MSVWIKKGKRVSAVKGSDESIKWLFWGFKRPICFKEMKKKEKEPQNEMLQFKFHWLDGTYLFPAVLSV